MTNVVMDLVSAPPGKISGGFFYPKGKYPMSLKNIKFSKLFLSLFMIVMITGCGSGGGGASSQSTTVPPVVMGSATISWSPVTTYADASNTPLTPVGYKIHYGTAPSYYTATTNILISQLTNTNSPRYTINGLSRGTTYYFAVGAYDSSNIESDLSDEVSATIK